MMSETTILIPEAKLPDRRWSMRGIYTNITEIRRKIFELEKDGYRVNAPIMKYCTDNASMVASSAFFFDNTYDDVDVEVFSRC